MSAQTLSISKSHSTGFSALDVLGISLSTLLFTIVWVSLFAIFVPETSNVVFSQGLEKIALKTSDARELQSLGSVLGASTVDIVKTGGNLSGVAEILNLDILFAPLTTGYGQVLGVSTSSVVLIGQGVLKYSTEYLNLLTFGVVVDKAGNFDLSTLTSMKHNLSIPALI